MSMPQKGSRKIVVKGVSYLWRVSQWKKISEWRQAEAESIDQAWLTQAQKFGLGAVADGEFYIYVELQKGASSQIHCAYRTLMVDGFLGKEQIAQIKPGLVRQVIEKALTSGWNPKNREDFQLTVLEDSGNRRPGLLILPGLATDSGGYEGKTIPVKLLWNQPKS